MPSPTEHCQQAEHNKDFLSGIDDKYLDWFVTTCYYASVHLLEACLAEGRPPRHSSDHSVRMGILRDLRKEATFRKMKIYSDYQSLWNLSREARYDCVMPSAEEKAEAKERLAEIESWALWKLGKAKHPHPEWRF